MLNVSSRSADTNFSFLSLNRATRLITRIHIIAITEQDEVIATTLSTRTIDIQCDENDTAMTEIDVSNGSLSARAKIAESKRRIREKRRAALL